MPDAPPAATRSESELRDSMSEEAMRIEYWARTWDATYRTLAQRWSTVNSVLVAIAALLAAAAGATGLGKVWSGSLGPGLLALTAAAISGTASALGTSGRATLYNTAAASNSALADAARVFRSTVVRDRPLDEVNREFEALCKQRDTAVASAPVSSGPIKQTAEQLAAWPPGIEAPRSHDADAPGGAIAT
jgi:hypothetical protein